MCDPRKMKPADVMAIAEKLERWESQGDISRRPWNPNRKFLGLVGERGFAITMGIDWPIDKLQNRNDGGVDFRLAYGTVDVKTTTHTPPNLLVEAFKVDSDSHLAEIFALMWVDPNTLKWLPVGWCGLETVAKAPRRQLRPDGPVNCVVPGSQLRPMDHLEWLEASCTGHAAIYK